MKAISFAVCCYNSAAYMSICIDSLLTAKDDVEIIVVDDGSTDETGAVGDRYAAEYPDTVRVIHKENGGHGSGIMAAYKIAVGKYFKVVDSDDWVNEKTLVSLISRIKGGAENPDLYVTDYDYFHGSKNDLVRHIGFGNVFPKAREITWKETWLFSVSEYLTLHSCMFRTQLIKDSDIQLPLKTFYEDNYFIYGLLPRVKTLVYVDEVFYCYNVGREGQSVDKAVGIRRYRDHLRVAELIFSSADVRSYRRHNRRLARTLYHHLRLVFMIAVLHTRMRKTPEAKADLKAFFARLRKNNLRQYRRLRYFSLATPICWPGFPGMAMTNLIYWFAHVVVPFN